MWESTKLAHYHYLPCTLQMDPFSGVRIEGLTSARHQCPVPMVAYLFVPLVVTCCPEHGNRNNVMEDPTVLIKTHNLL